MSCARRDSNANLLVGRSPSRVRASRWLPRLLVGRPVPVRNRPSGPVSLGGSGSQLGSHAAIGQPASGCADRPAMRPARSQATRAPLTARPVGTLVARLTGVSAGRGLPGDAIRAGFVEGV